MRFVSSIALAALLVPLGSVRGAQPGSQTDNGIAVKVNDAIITFQEIYDEIDDNSLRLLRVQYGRQPELYQQKIEQLKSDTLQLLIERQLILDEFKSGESAGNYKFPESYIDDEMKRRIRDKFGDRVTMIKSLEHDGMSYEAFRRRLREDFIVGAMEFKNAGAEKIIVSPHKIEAYYTNNLEQFKVEDEVKLRMIFLRNKPDRDAAATRKLADEILAKVKGGAAFAEMASANSDDSYRSEGGLRPAEFRKTLREDLASVAFSLKPGETSDVLERDDGCYLIKVEEFHPAHVKPLNEVRVEIEKTLTTGERRRLRNEWIARLKAKSFIKSFID